MKSGRSMMLSISHDGYPHAEAMLALMAEEMGKPMTPAICCVGFVRISWLVLPVVMLRTTVVVVRW